VIEGKLQLKHAVAAKKNDTNKSKKQIYQHVGIAEQQKAGLQGRFDSINSSGYNSPMYLFFNMQYGKRSI